MSVTYAKRAQIDLYELEADLILHQGLKAAAQFHSRLRRTLTRLERFPFSAALHEPPDPHYPGMRVSQVHKSEWFAVYYQPLPKGIRVVRVLHTSRDVTAIINLPDPE